LVLAPTGEKLRARIGGGRLAGVEAKPKSGWIVVIGVAERASGKVAEGVVAATVVGVLGTTEKIWPPMEMVVGDELVGGGSG
jgi:hypothetical protein